MEESIILMLYSEILELKRMLSATNAPAPTLQLWDGSEVKQFLKISESTLYRLRKNGDIPYVEVGNRYYYPKQVILEQLAQRIAQRNDPSKKFDT